MPMNEDQVVEATAALLESQGWTIVSKCTTSQTGIDIVATKDGQRALFEAKGLTSAVPSSTNYGKPYYEQQKRHNVAEAVMTSCELRSKYPHDLVNLALPIDRVYRNRIAAVQPALNHLEVAIYWVADDGTVTPPGR